MHESFTDKVIDHFMAPRNCGTMPDANGEEVLGIQAVVII